MTICKSCGKEIKKEWRKDKTTIKNKPLVYCSRSCANSRGPRSEEFKEKVSKKLKGKVFREYPKPKPKYRICSICGEEFQVMRTKSGRFSYRKTCSDICKSLAFSLSAQNRIKKQGIWSTPKTDFIYKDISISCDSKLEEAGIIYLKDILKVDKIERFNNLVHYWVDGSHKTFNPDFWVKKDKTIFIAEVKMVWVKNIDHHYNKTIPYKKEALKEFCNDKGYKLIWLDFDYDDKFKCVYKEHLKSTQKARKQIGQG